jgi:hypothetical protein
MIFLHGFVLVVDENGTFRATRAFSRLRGFFGLLGKRDGRKSGGFCRIIGGLVIVGSTGSPYYIVFRRNTVVQDGSIARRLTAGSGKRARPCSTSDPRGNLLRRRLGWYL